jgi:hypothetical protein
MYGALRDEPKSRPQRFRYAEGWYFVMVNEVLMLPVFMG